MLNELTTAISSACTIAKQLLELKGVASNASAKLLIAELQVQLAELKTRLAELLLENVTLKESLRLALATNSRQSVLRDGLYWDNTGSGPYCTACLDQHRNWILLTELPADLPARWLCPACQAAYGIHF